jgi:3-deoxy-7-phosphoheptulonate synthase
MESMIIKMKKNASEKEVQVVSQAVQDIGFQPWVSRGAERTIIGVLGSGTEDLPTDHFEVLSGVEGVVRISESYKLASRNFKEESTVVDVGGVKIGDGNFVVMAGPCSVEHNPEVTLVCARIAKENGAQFLRGGAYKPRSSPFSFQGVKEEGLKILARAREETGLLVVTEVLSEYDVELVAQYADILQIGARNMKNYRLLELVGKSHKPVLLKRGESASVEEWLMAADYILRENGDHPNVILCHRGIRTFENDTRYTFDIGVIPVIKRLSHLPVITDPSHAAGKAYLVSDYSKMAVAGGSDGLIVEIHPNPSKALSDGPQSLKFDDFSQMMQDLKTLARAMGKKI